MLDFYKCSKCGFQFVSTEETPKEMICGVFIGYNEDLAPVGCGGQISKITEEEAMTYE